MIFRFIFLGLLLLVPQSYGMFGGLYRAGAGLRLFQAIKDKQKSDELEQCSTTYRRLVEKVGRFNLLYEKGLFPWLIASPFRCKKFNLREFIKMQLPLLSALRFLSLIKHPCLLKPKHYENVTELIAQIIETEVKYPGYTSFFHAADGRIALLLDLQKKLYQLQTGVEPKDFEFLRSRKKVEHLRGMTVEEYKKMRPGRIHDADDFVRTEILSAAREPWFYFFLHLYTKSRSVNLPLRTLLKSLLSDYNLSFPDTEIPRIKNGLFLHFLIQNELIPQLVYTAISGGTPLEHHRLWKPLAAIIEKITGVGLVEKRIVMDPEVVCEPNENFKVFRHQILEPEEKSAQDLFVDKLIADAKDLKVQQSIKECFYNTMFH
ncbi:TPA: hypothetical protein DIC20_02720 [Candidatus Dependentiae bacterium]|nr:MAG: hypothetical protein US03_C0009G0005 [candidate division TM6 bacterium GW2011_GWF2_36_131]KKQ02843.1 MAG: hypothetical protein US13_C0009G0035 [candidate division TM6 bacterium GW2011_GWE2_36_25]KKQ18248.1 MAG: hypothetical protein US32_C0028G0005 [candidate division TM6 bacterium GW2011_GWA2_36_9]HBR70209.1 hypothetical protein [Candidatus Dependentiae bacterium]HCU00593.1 hypothetical protein [Candidatus Dependentiae bacterium]